jgi:Tfp pilus assembly protein FimT
LFNLFIFTPNVAIAAECRTAALPDGNPALFCKDKKGNWKQQEGKVQVAPAAATVGGGNAQPLYADASYRGTATFTYPIKTKQRRSRNILDVVIAGTEPKTTKEEIFVSTTMRIEGEVVSGHITGGSWTTKVPITGVRKDGVCNISATLNGDTAVYVGKCDANGFAGQVDNYFARGGSSKGEFQLGALSFTDTSQRDAERAALKKRCDEGSNTACVELEQKK